MKILAVDDEKLVLEALVDAIQGAAPGAEIHGFQNAQDAIDFAQKEVCEVAFIDIRLRGTTGLKLALELKKHWPSVNIIFATGYDEYAMEAMRLRASGYIMKPVSVDKVKEELSHLRIPLSPERARIHAQTFGNFELFVDKTPVKFESARSKELLAFLVDRRGAMVSNAEIAATIWESNDNIASTQAQVRKAKSSLMSSLKECGIGEILRISRYELGVKQDGMSCDYWQMLEGDVRVLNSFRGEYMTGYSWAELTLGSLMDRIYSE